MITVEVDFGYILPIFVYDFFHSKTCWKQAAVLQFLHNKTHTPYNGPQNLRQMASGFSDSTFPGLSYTVLLFKRPKQPLSPFLSSSCSLCCVPFPQVSTRLAPPFPLRLFRYVLLNGTFIHHQPYCYFLFFLWYWGLNSEPSPWVTTPALFGGWFFWDRVSWPICPRLLWTAILLISAS
jgi:hypothetical protein